MSQERVKAFLVETDARRAAQFKALTEPIVKRCTSANLVAWSMWLP